MDQQPSDYSVRDLVQSLLGAVNRFVELLAPTLELYESVASEIKITLPVDQGEAVATTGSDEPYRIEDCHSFYILDKNGDRIAGADVFKRHGVLHLTNLHTHPDHRRKGLANKIMRTVVNHYPREVMHLNVWSYGNRPLDDYRLIEFYRKWGFALVADGGGKMIRCGVQDDRAQWSTNR